MMTPAENQFPKVCSCCSTSYSAADWAKLAFVGWMGDEEEMIELRNCPCRGTLAVVVVDEAPEVAPARDPRPWVIDQQILCAMAREWESRRPVLAPVGAR